MVPVLTPTPIYRITHAENLRTLLRRGALHAAAHVPDDGLPYRPIHDADVQASRMVQAVPCGPGGQLLDYVPFYFGPRSPMLYRVHTGWGVPQVDQCRIVYLVSDTQRIAGAGIGFVFFDGHALAGLSRAYDDLKDLGQVDWDAVRATQWSNTFEDPDRQRRKQAEFLVHRSMPWDLVTEVGVLNRAVNERVVEVLDEFPDRPRPVVSVRPEWYY